MVHLPAALRALLLGGLLVGLGLWFAASPRATEGGTAPFVFTDIDGRTVRLTDFRGRWVLVNFWAHWCPLCWPEIPVLNEFNRREDFVVIGIGMDYGSDEAAVRDAVARHNVQFQAIVAGGSRRDANSPVRQIGPVDFFPSSYIYAPNGERVMFIPGQVRLNKVLSFMESWQASRRGAPPPLAPAIRSGKLEAFLARNYGAQGRKAYADWRALLDGLAGTPVQDRLSRVNDFFNRRITQGQDSRIWGKPDYWATLGETLGKGAGDSEDFVIAKYFTLLSLGIPADDLRLVYARLRVEGPSGKIPADKIPGGKTPAGKASTGKSPVHMVLAYYPTPEGEPLLLDNRVRDIRPASAHPDLHPVFSFNGQDIWGDAVGMSGQGADASYRLPIWQDTLRRARNEGFE